MTVTPRLARLEEVKATRTLVRDACALYLPRMDREPAPMLADYAALTAEARGFGLPAIELYTNAVMTENFPFYASLGYEMVGEAEQDVIRDAQ